MRSGVFCCCWHILYVCSNLRQVTSPLDVPSAAEGIKLPSQDATTTLHGWDVAKCVVGTIDRIALQARCKKHAIEVFCVFSKYYKEQQHNSAFPLFNTF